MYLYLFVIVLALIYFLLKNHLKYWKKQGVPGPEPHLLVGNVGANVIGRKYIGDLVTEIYREYDGYPFVGIYKGMEPSLLIRDPEMLKTFLVKDFKHFSNNDLEVNKEVDPLLGRNPFVLRGEEWKTTRAQLTPGFTSGKMKAVFPLMEGVAKSMVEYLSRTPEAVNGTGLEAKDLCTKFTTDSVAACAFGVEARCFVEPNSEFRQLARRFLSAESWRSLAFLFFFLFPKLTTLVSLKAVPADVDEKLMEIVKANIKYREENKIDRNDFLQFMMHLMKTSKTITEVDATAHAASFFGDGVETSSMVMSFLLYELASNVEIQEKLRQSINNVLEEKYEGKLCYEAVQDMDYLEACLQESLRKNPPAGMLLKKCTEKYTYTSESPDFKKLSVTLKEGDGICVPVMGLAMDPKYFPEPDKFIPERMLDKEKIPKFAFLPFGEGPRACLGRRFGILQIKVGVVYILRNFTMTLNRKTQLPLRNKPLYFINSPIGGLWLDFEKIHH